MEKEVASKPLHALRFIEHSLGGKVIRGKSGIRVRSPDEDLGAKK